MPLRVLLRKLKIANYEASEIRHHWHALLERHLGKPGSGGVLDLKSIIILINKLLKENCMDFEKEDQTCRSSGMLLRATYLSDGRTSVVEKVDLYDGSSKQGNADRASVG